VTITAALPAASVAALVLAIVLLRRRSRAG
jgi:hypothetical protein